MSEFAALWRGTRRLYLSLLLCGEALGGCVWVCCSVKLQRLKRSKLRVIKTYSWVVNGWQTGTLQMQLSLFRWCSFPAQLSANWMPASSWLKWMWKVWWVTQKECTKPPFAQYRFLYILVPCMSVVCSHSNYTLTHIFYHLMQVVQDNNQACSNKNIKQVIVINFS